MAKYKTGHDAKFADSSALDDDDDDECEAPTTHVDNNWQQPNNIGDDEKTIAAALSIGSRPLSALHPNIRSATIGDISSTEIETFVVFIQLNPLFAVWTSMVFVATHLQLSPIHHQSTIITGSRPTSSTYNLISRLKWIAYLEFTHSDITTELTWRNIVGELPKSDKLASLVTEGVPHALRPFIWARLCGAVAKKRRAPFAYCDAVTQATSSEKVSVIKQIDKDLLRTMPHNVCFRKADSGGVMSLRRVLRAIAYLYPDLGYCQGMGVVVASLLLFCDEELVFWIMSTLIEHVLPANYYSQNLLGLQADQRVLRLLIDKHIPEIGKIFREQDIEIGLITLNWFLTVFASVLPMRILVRVWDVVFYEGTVALFRLSLAMIKLHVTDLESAANQHNGSADVFNLLSQLPSLIDNADQLIEMAASFSLVTDELVTSMRKKQQALLMADQGMFINVEATDMTNLPKQQMQPRKLLRSKSLVQHILEKSTDSDDDPKRKNIRQTELIVDFKEAILTICRYFISSDASLEGTVITQADYSAPSHMGDHDRFLSGRRTGRRRARALLDFERQDDDELGFRKNDIITILSERDEHCWVGELNGLRGWFPAKFVEVLDERGKSYSAFGDDAVSEPITDLVRGNLATALKQILEYGLRKSSVLSGPCHPWIFIEEISNRCVQRDFKSVYSRLILCRTFRLDEDGKVLTPEELLFRAVQLINISHDSAKVQMDVKLRSLICLGVNEQCLHLWFELLCCSAGQDAVRAKWYHSWSFMRSPAWIQIKCELRLLTQFSFNLNPDFELPPVTAMRRKVMNERKISGMPPSAKAVFGGESAERPLKEGVRDMLVKHHLFSWDL